MPYGNAKYGVDTYGSSGVVTPPVTTTRWLAAEAKFKENLSSPTSASATSLGPGLVGADICNTIYLGGNRHLWVNGDTYWAGAAGETRNDSVNANGLIHSTVGLQVGNDITTSTLTWYHGTPGFNTNVLPFFKNKQVQGTSLWRYPIGGIKLDDRVLLMGMYCRNKPTSGTSYNQPIGPGNLGTSMSGPWAIMAYNTDDTPNNWILSEMEWGIPKDSYHGYSNSIPANVPQYCPMHNPVDLGDGYLYTWCFGPSRLDTVALCRFSRARAKMHDLNHIEWHDGAGKWYEDRAEAQNNYQGRTNAGFTRRHRVDMVTVPLNQSDQIGGVHLRPDGQIQLTYIPDWQIDRTAVPGGTWIDTDPRVRYSLINNPTQKFSTHAEIFDIALLTNDFAYGAYCLENQTWSGKNVNDQMISYSVNNCSLGSNFSDARTYWPQFVRAIGI